MLEPRPDPMTELVRILREQLDHKDDRIAALEKLVEQANHRIDEQQRLMVRLLERSFERTWEAIDGTAAQATQPAMLTSADRHTEPAKCPSEDTDGAQTAGAWRRPDATDAESAPETHEPALALATLEPDTHVTLPDLGPQIEVIAEAVVTAAARQPVHAEHASDGADSDRAAMAGRLQEYIASQEEIEITLRLDRQKLHKGHRAVERAKRGLLPWRRNREA